MTNAKPILTLSLLFVCLSINAQMTLRECMQYAVENSAKMKIRQTETDNARISRRDAVLQAFTPFISGNTSAGYSFGRSINPETNTYFTSVSFNNAYSLNLSISLFDGFSAVNNLKITRTAMAMGKNREQQEADAICLATMEAYYNAVYYEQLLEIVSAQVETARQSLTLARRQEELGQKGYADVVQTEAELTDRQYQQVTARNAYNDAMLTLKDLMFWPMDQELDIDTSMAGNADVLDPQGELVTAEIISNAQNSMPKAFIAKGEMANAKRELSTAKWQMVPSLSLGGSISTGYYNYPGQSGYKAMSFGHQFKNNLGEYIGLSLTIPIYGKLSGQSSILRKKNAYKKARTQYDQTMREIETEVRRAVQDRDGASAAFLQADKRASVQEEAYRLNSKKFEQGLISPIELQNATNNYLNAKTERLNSLLKYYIKRSIVMYYNGVNYLNQ